MFYYLNGKLTILKPDAAVIDCGGVGYLLSISATTYQRLLRTHPLSPDGTPDGKDALLYTYFCVREDSQELFGFYDEEECTVFKLLITVSGIGPRGALSILSALTPSEIAIACSEDDAKAIARANGVGLKTAQKVIIELKDKIANTIFTSSSAPADDKSDTRSSIGAVNDAISALSVLGYSRAEAARAVKECGNGTTEELIRKALQKLMK